MDKICADLKANAGQILDEWDQVVQREPWLTLPKTYRIDHLGQVIIGLAEASLCSPYDVEAHLQKLRAAAKHGADRRNQGFGEDLLLREYHLLRQVLWSYLQRQKYSRTLEAITRLDTAISLATSASLRGFYQEEFEKKGEWPECIDEMVKSSPFLNDTPDA